MVEESLPSIVRSRWVGAEISDSVPRHAQQFFTAGQAGVHQALAVLAHQGHALGLGGGGDFGLGRAAVDEGTHCIVHHQQLEDAGAPGIAGVAAVLAAHGAVFPTSAAR